MKIRMRCGYDGKCAIVRTIWPPENSLTLFLVKYLIDTQFHDVELVQLCIPTIISWANIQHMY